MRGYRGNLRRGRPGRRTDTDGMWEERFDHPVPHLLVDSRKEMHGWWPGKRECTSERLLLNPYNGCSLNCLGCYAQSYPGYFQLFLEHRLITVFRDFHLRVGRQLDSLAVASCGYLSPVTDPFQPLNEYYHLSESIIQEFIVRKLPIEFVTKSKVPPDVIELFQDQPHCFAQFSLLTPHESLRTHLMEGGATTPEILQQMSRVSRIPRHVVCRLDPIIPYLTDAMADIDLLVAQARDSGCRHIVASVMDIPFGIKEHVLRRLGAFGRDLVTKIQKLYSERIDGWLQADIFYRRGIFGKIRNICDRYGLTFALCMEYELVEGRAVGLNRDFMSSRNCEGIDIPLYGRRGKVFEPLTDCAGDCLHCREASCGIADLALAAGVTSKRSFRLSDYRRWSREMSSDRLGTGPQ